MFSATIQKLTVFVLLFGWSIPLGSALLKNVIHSQDITGASVASIAGHLKARASLVDYTEAYNQLMRLLHDIYGDDVSQVLQDPEWLTRVCSQACAPDDQQCHQECAEKQIGYLDVNHIARCATHCENIPHQAEAPLQGEYGACLVPCLKHQHENTNAVEKPTMKNPTPTGAVDVPSTKSKANQNSSQTFPYYVTLMDATTTSVVQVISQVTYGVEDLSTENEELKYLTPVVKTVTSPTIANSGTAIVKETTIITGTAQTVAAADLGVQNGPTFAPAPSFTSNISTNPLAPTAPPVAGTTLFQLVDAKALPTPLPSIPVFNTDATTVVDEDPDLIPSNTDNNTNQPDTAPTLATVVMESDLKTPAPSPTPTATTDASGALKTLIVGGLDGLEASALGVMKKVGSGLNFTNMTVSTSARPSTTLEPGLAEGAAAIDTPFLSFGTSASVLLAVVIGLVMG